MQRPLIGEETHGWCIQTQSASVPCADLHVMKWMFQIIGIILQIQYIVPSRTITILVEKHFFAWNRVSRFNHGRFRDHKPVMPVNRLLFKKCISREEFMRTISEHKPLVPLQTCLCILSNPWTTARIELMTKASFGSSLYGAFARLSRSGWHRRLYSLIRRLSLLTWS